MKYVYLVLAIVGAAVPYYFFLQHFGAEGLALPAFVAAVFANPAASGFTSDLLIGLSCALPAYLYWRERSRA